MHGQALNQGARFSESCCRMVTTYRVFRAGMHHLNPMSRQSF